MSIAIETEALTKTFPRPAGLRRIARVKPITAVKDVNLSVPSGELFGLLGPNGAGKTTLVKILSTLILPTSGRALVAGHSLQQDSAIRADVGLVVADERSFYWRLSGRQNLLFFAAMHGMYGMQADARVTEVLAEVDMLERADDRFSNYSTGMRQRLAIGRGLLHRPQILFLDEPSRSLDPTATQRLHELVRRLLARQDVTIFLITHDLAEAEKLCDRVAVMHQGRIQVTGKPVDLRRRLARRLRYTARLDALSDAHIPLLRRHAPDLRMERETGHILLHFEAGETEQTLNAVLDTLRGLEIQIFSIEAAPPSLEEVFAHFTGSLAAEVRPQPMDEGMRD